MFSLPRLLAVAATLVCGISQSTSAQQAHFSVREDVVNPDLPAFTATVNDLGNGQEFLGMGGGFEPAVFRTMISAEGDSPDSIIAAPQVISGWDSWPEGLLDGADVEVLRVVGGKLVTVRSDRIAQRGFHASGWRNMLRDGEVLGPDQTRFSATWDGYNRLDAPWYYAVRAVDRSGNMSPLSSIASVIPPAKPGKGEGRPATLNLRVGSGASSLPAPGNLQARVAISQTLLLSWDPVPGAAGYVVYRSDLPPEQLRGYGIRLEGPGEPIKVGDMVLLRKEFRLPQRGQVATKRTWNLSAAAGTFGVPFVSGLPGDPDMPQIRLVDHPADTPVTDPGRTYLEATLKPGESLPIGRYSYAGAAQGYYPVLDPKKTYRIEAWLRSEGDITATFRLTGPQSNIPGVPGSVRPDGTWRRYGLDFRVPSIFTGKQPGEIQIVLSGSGRVDIDNFRIYDTSAPFMELTADERAALDQSGLEALRTHMFIKTGMRTYDLAQLLSPAGVNPRSRGATVGQFLKISAETGINPWLQIEPHLTHEEWLGLVEYLAAPFDPAKDDPKAMPWAAMRVAQGQAAPWTDRFPWIYFEVGNETWNRMFYPWIFPEMVEPGLIGGKKYSGGAVYGLFQERVLSIMRESPWWSRLEPRLEPVLGGWKAVPFFGFDALKHSPSSKALTVADYTGGWDSGEGPVRPVPEGYFSVMAFAPQAMIGPAEAAHEELRKMGRDKVVLGTYEAGPGYSLNGLNGQKVTPEQDKDQELVMKSAATGAATLDGFLARAQTGDRLQNYFMFGTGAGWRSHALWQNGGQAYPSWAWLALFNRVGTGDLLAVDTIDVPRQDLPEMGRRKAMAGVPMAAAYASRRGDRLTVTVISRQVPGVPAGTDGRMSVVLDLPITGATRLTRYRATGDYRAENSTAEESRIAGQDLPLPSDPARLEIRDMPPASADIYVFEGARFR